MREIITHGDGWYIANGVTLHKNLPVTLIDRAAKRVVSTNSIVADYDHLVIATGSRPFIPPVPGHQLPGVITYHDLDDVDKMLAVAKGSKIVVINGDLFGLEAAADLKMQGIDVTALHLMPTLMERQLDPAAGYLLENAFTERGVKVITQSNTKQVLGSDHIEGVELADGTVIECSMVVMGIRPAMALAKASGLAVNRGIVVDDQMRTDDPYTFALGECAEHRGTCYGLVAPLYEIGQVLASTLVDEAAIYQSSMTSTKLKVIRIDLFLAGDFGEGEDREEIVLRDASADIYKRLVLKDDRIIVAALCGEKAYGP